jgi:hypothetical protein
MKKRAPGKRRKKQPNITPHKGDQENILLSLTINQE